MIVFRGGANTSSQDLLYVTGACGGVCVFSYPSGTLVGELADSNEPLDGASTSWAMCSWSTSAARAEPPASSSTRTAEEPIATLSDPGYYPEACSIDPTTGNLAVTNNSVENGDTGVVAIYVDANGEATITSIQKSITWDSADTTIRATCR